jgi:DNA-binding transcriptional LysR family regulator
VELRQLRYFVTIARLESMTAAAETLHVAQPALSAQVAKLEHEWGTQVFERAGRGLRLTEAGRALYRSAERVLSGADGLADLAGALRAGATGHLRIGYGRSFPFRDLTAILRTFRANHPGVALTLEEAETETQLRMLRRGDLDAAFIRLSARIDRTDLHVDALASYEPMIVLPADHPLADRTALTLAELVDDDWVLLSREYGDGYRERIAAAFLAAGFAPRVRQEAADVRIVLGLVAAGLGVTVLTSSSRELGITGVRYVPFGQPPSAFEFVMASRSNAHIAPVTILRQAVRQYAGVPVPAADG